MRRIILSLFATGLLAACPGDSGVPPPSPTTPLAGEAMSLLCQVGAASRP